MGGGQSLQIGLGHLDLFSSVGAFSSAAPADFETRFAELLDARGIRHTYRATEGLHTYTVWRQYLGEFAPLLFK
jgi:enterochelin esterase family protein